VESNEERVAKALTNEALADRLERITRWPTSWSAAEREAFVMEAAKRLKVGALTTRRG